MLIHSNQDTWPPDLAHLVSKSRELRLPRDSESSHSSRDFLRQEQADVDSMSDYMKENDISPTDAKLKPDKRRRTSRGEKEDVLDHLLQLFMSGKKKHEVVRMGVAVKEVMRHAQIKTVLGTPLTVAPPAQFF